MTRNEKLLAIINSCQGLNSVDDIFKKSGIRASSTRIYANVLADMGIFKKVMISNAGRGIYAYEGTNQEITDDLLDEINYQVSEFYKQQKIMVKNNYLAGKSEQKISKENQCKNEMEALTNQKLGIYLLSSKPSTRFQKLFKEQNKQSQRERKSPKNYAGTSAGMVW